ncbi:MAG: hypothetical protein QOD93_5345, partial [Acetobacteraceae bacterium]|nr:hypothetical protein [Acetobacteraceae bacterium]
VNQSCPTRQRRPERPVLQSATTAPPRDLTPCRNRRQRGDRNRFRHSPSESPALSSPFPHGFDALPAAPAHSTLPSYCNLAASSATRCAVSSRSLAARIIVSRAARRALFALSCACCARSAAAAISSDVSRIPGIFPRESENLQPLHRDFRVAFRTFLTPF